MQGRKEFEEWMGGIRRPGPVVPSSEQQRVWWEQRLLGQIASEYQVNITTLTSVRAKIRDALRELRVREEIAYAVLDRMLRAGLLKLYR